MFVNNEPIRCIPVGKIETFDQAYSSKEHPKRNPASWQKNEIVGGPPLVSSKDENGGGGDFESANRSEWRKKGE